MTNALGRATGLLAALSLFTFAIADWVPGDYFSTLRANPEISPATLEAMRQRMHEERTWGMRYASWWGSALTGDFGVSLAYGAPVKQLVLERAPATFQLNLVSTLLAWTLASFLGAWAAWTRGWPDRLVRVLQAMLLGLPEILLALLGLWWFGGRRELPYAVLALGALPTLVMHVRASVADALQSPAVEAARHLGIGGARLWASYVMPAAAPPLVSLAGLSVGGLLSASLLVEAALEIPGLGTLFLDAIQARDTAVVAGIVALSGVTLVAANLLADVARWALDPRLRRLAE